MENFLFSLFPTLFRSLTLNGQTTRAPKNTPIGFEADVLPYLTGGYYDSVWLSNRHLRYRAVVTNVTTSEFLLQEGYTNNELMVCIAPVYCGRQ